MVGEEIAALAQEADLLLSEATWLEADVGTPQPPLGTPGGRVRVPPP